MEDWKTLGWTENDQTHEKTLDDLAKLMQRNKEQLLEKYQIRLKPSYYSTMRECLAALKTKIGEEKMGYWKKQGWTESGTTEGAVNDLAIVMDMTRTQLLSKYKISSGIGGNRTNFEYTVSTFSFREFKIAHRIEHHKTPSVFNIPRLF